MGNNNCTHEQYDESPLGEKCKNHANQPTLPERESEDSSDEYDLDLDLDFDPFANSSAHFGIAAAKFVRDDREENDDAPAPAAAPDLAPVATPGAAPVAASSNPNLASASIPSPAAVAAPALDRAGPSAEVQDTVSEPQVEKAPSLRATESMADWLDELNDAHPSIEQALDDDILRVSIKVLKDVNKQPEAKRFQPAVKETPSQQAIDTVLRECELEAAVKQLTGDLAQTASVHASLHNESTVAVHRMEALKARYAAANSHASDVVADRLVNNVRQSSSSSKGEAATNTEVQAEAKIEANGKGEEGKREAKAEVEAEAKAPATGNPVVGRWTKKASPFQELDEEWVVFRADGTCTRYDMKRWTHLRRKKQAFNEYTGNWSLDPKTELITMNATHFVYEDDHLPVAKRKGEKDVKQVFKYKKADLQKQYNHASE